MEEQTLFDVEIDNSKWRVSNFSAGDVNIQAARLKLEDKYWKITEITDKFNRKSVSYQLSKNDRLHRWLKYKEGFSAELVRILLRDFKIKPGQNVLDPFMGSGTTALVARMGGMNSWGVDILPLSKLSILSKSSVYDYDISELDKVIEEVHDLNTPANYSKKTPFVSTTEDGYPEQTSKDLAYYKEFFDNSNHSEEAKRLVTLCTLNTLESISYSRKDGQYLRWDYRCPKMVRGAVERELKGKKPLKTMLDKGTLPSLKEALLSELNNVISDIKDIQTAGHPQLAKSYYIEGSSLFELPQMPSNSIDCVISSPPYCNRYDYTRTYALELAYLGVDTQGIRMLRQDLLSCTVESKSKLQALEDFYIKLDRGDFFYKTLAIVKNNEVLEEILIALKQRSKNGEINNKGVIQMVEGYFTELAFIFAEIYRVCRNGARVAFVNDNVRYAGEVIPVDYLTTMLAESIGFKPIVVYTLYQQKGNSSQQMKKYGKVNLRKSITVWEKQ